MNLNSSEELPQTFGESREAPLARRFTASAPDAARQEPRPPRAAQQRDERPREGAGRYGGERPVAQDIGIAVVLAGAGLMTSIAFGLISPDGIFHYDDLTHYLYAKWAWKWPAYLVDTWGRPGFTVLYFLPAGLGWWACRVLSAVLTAVSALLAFFVARRMGLRHAWAVVPLAYAQPLFFQLSQTTLTETALAFYLVLAVFLAQRGRWSLSAAVLSLGLVTRHEAIVFVPLWAWFAWRGERTGFGFRAAGCGAGPPNPEARYLLPLWPIIWAPLAVNAACLLLGLEAPLSRLFEPRPSELYGHGGWLTFFCRTLEAWGPGVTVLAMLGLYGTWRTIRGGPPDHSRDREGGSPHPNPLPEGEGENPGRDRKGAVPKPDTKTAPRGTGPSRPGSVRSRLRSPLGPLVASCIVVYFAAQTVVRALGLYDSGGYARFLVPISPLVAIAALAGWHRLWVREPRRLRLAVVYAAGFMVLLRLSMDRQVALYASQPAQIAAVPHLEEAVAAMRFAAVALVVIAAVSCALSIMGERRARARPGEGAGRYGGERRASSKRLAIGRVLVPAALVAMILLADYALCYPLRPPAAARMVDDLRTSLRDNGLAGREIISAHVWVDYAAGNELPLPRPSVCRRLQLAPIGAVFVWDGQFAATERGLQLADIGTSSAFRRIYTAQPWEPPGARTPRLAGVYFIAFEKIGPWECPAPGP